MGQCDRAPVVRFQSLQSLRSMGIANLPKTVVFRCNDTILNSRRLWPCRDCRDDEVVAGRGRIYPRAATSLHCTVLGPLY